MVDPAVLSAAAASAQQAGAQARQAARRERTAGHWFTPEHAWVAITGKTATVRITEYAVEVLGRILYVSLPVAGSTVTARQRCGEVESTHSIGDLYAPIDGTVAEINDQLDIEPGLINAKPYGAGWMFRVTVGVVSEATLTTTLLSPPEYEELVRILG